MFKISETAGTLVISAVLFLSAPAAAESLQTQDSGEAAPAAGSEPQCLDSFHALQKNFAASNLEFTAMSGDARTIVPLTYIHARKDGRSYSLWKTLNGEVSGYALRDGKGFDFNRDRSYTGPLTWHTTQIFDRFFSEGTKLRSYNCLIAGRSRISGYKAALLRFVPEDGLRYGYVLAYDEDEMLPVELMMTAPSGMVVSRISATSIKKSSTPSFPVDDETFDLHEGRAAQQQKLPDSPLDPWDFLVIPPDFVMTDSGVLKFKDGEVSPYQVFSDGLTDFRIYINSKSSLYLPAVNTGSLTVFRKADQNREYAVTGEIPLALAEEILSKVKGDSEQRP